MIDSFVKIVAIITISLIMLMCLNTYIGTRLGNKLDAIDDTVTEMAIQGHDKQPSSFLELPRDVEVGVFTAAGLGAGIIIGYLWRKLFSERLRIQGSK